MLKDTLARLSDAEEVSRQMQEALRIAKKFQSSTLDMVLRKLGGSGSSWEPNPRYDAIHDASANTFRWILSQPEKLLQAEKNLKMTFPDWLRHGDGVFRVAGKPGSGKSTLMKFICEEEVVREYLREWAGPSRLIFAQYFFWKPDPLQNGFHGFKRSLLRTIVQQVPELCEVLFPRLETQATEFLSTDTPKYSDKEVSRSLEAFWSHIGSSDSIRICVVIDGLDEFEEGANDHHDLVDTLQNWSHKASRRAKICVSSRESGAFSVSPHDKTMWLHSFTEEDIQSFITNRLWTHPRFPRVRALPRTLETNTLCAYINYQAFFGEPCPHSSTIECQANGLLEYITRRAGGVFLWVDLLLRDLRKCLDHGFPLSHLQGRVRYMPEGLENFLVHLLETIHPHSRRESYILLALIQIFHSWGLSLRDMVCLLNIRTASCLYKNQLTGLPPIDSDSFRLHMNLIRNEEPTCLRPEQLSGLCNGLISVDKSLHPMFTHETVLEVLDKHLPGKLYKYGITQHFLGIVTCRLLICRILFDFKAPRRRESKASWSDGLLWHTFDDGTIHRGTQALLMFLTWMSLSRDPSIFEYLSIVDDISSDVWRDTQMPYGRLINPSGCRKCRYHLGFDGHAILQSAICSGDLSYILWRFSNHKVERNHRVAHMLLYNLQYSNSPDAPAAMHLLFREQFCVLDKADKENSFLIDRRQSQDRWIPPWHIYWDAVSAYELWHKCLIRLIATFPTNIADERIIRFENSPQFGFSDPHNWEVIEY